MYMMIDSPLPNKEAKTPVVVRPGEPDAVLYLVNFENGNDTRFMIQIKNDSNSSRACSSYKQLKGNYPNDQCFLFSFHDHEQFKNDFPNDVSASVLVKSDQRRIILLRERILMILLLVLHRFTTS
jgi:hypothetical protein